MNPRSRFSVYLGRLFGIRFYLDPSWFLIAGLVTYTLSRDFSELLPGHGEPLYLLLGASVAALFFSSILLHELGHSLVSQRCGIPVPRITLLFIGGIAEISREPDTARAELKIAVAGPAVSAVLVLCYGTLAFVLHQMGLREVAGIFRWLALVNLGLIIFNAIPGYPLDGGRVLRALLWERTGNLRRATYISTRIGVGFSWLLIALGIAMLGASVLTPMNFAWNAFVFLLIGVFLKRAAESGYRHTIYHEVLGGVRVRDLMTRAPAVIPASLPLSLAVDEFFLVHHHVAYPVCGDTDEFRGLLRLEFLKDVPREKWPYLTAGDLAADQATISLCIDSAEPAEKAMRRLLAPGQGRLAVVENGRVTGMITRHDVLHFIKIHTELET